MNLEFKDIDLYFRVSFVGSDTFLFSADFDFDSYDDAHNFALLLRKADPYGTIKLSVESADFEY